MNITFLIGNGFDIKLGLKTRYTDFYPTYIDSNKHSKEESIKKFTELIDSNYETWSDFEMAFAKNIFGTRIDVRNILYDFSVKFTDYLKEQIKLCDYSDNNIYGKFKSFLLYGYENLESRDRQTLKSIYDSFDESILINFINFNYTDTLNNLIKICEDKSNSNLLQKKYAGYLKRDVYIGNLINIHGSIDDSIILGIDSIEQLENDALKKENGLGKYCVKSEMNNDMGNQQIEQKLFKTIKSSNIIYSYGISFGDSDKSRWEIIAEWLKTNKKNKLVIYKYETNFKNYNPAYKRKLLDAIEELKDYYLGLLGFDENEYESYYDQIFVIDSDDVLDFKLINDKMTNEQEESLEVFTA